MSAELTSAALASLIAERHKLDRAIAALSALAGNVPDSSAPPLPRTYRRGLTASVIAIAGEHPNGIRGCDLARAVGRDQAAITSLLKRIAADGRITKIGAGLYGPASPAAGLPSSDGERE